MYILVMQSISAELSPVSGCGGCMGNSLPTLDASPYCTYLHNSMSSIAPTLRVMVSPCFTP